jgi:hypothetical protein
VQNWLSMPETPSEWPRRQSEFRYRFENHRDEITGVPVHWRANAQSEVLNAKRLLYPLLYPFFTSSDPIDGPVVSIWPYEAPVGAPASLIFEIAPHPSLADEGNGMLYGEFTLNGALCLEIESHEVLWPVYNPRPPAFRAKRR